MKTPQKIVVNIQGQLCFCYQGEQLVRQASVSTSARGAGQLQGSYQTPLGDHIVRAKIGADLPIGSVFVGRRPTGEIWSEQLHEQFPDRDWVLTRILWLSGTQIGHNRLGPVDSMRRYIYFHGTPDEHLLGVPSSHGCIRMNSEDLTWIFNWVNLGTQVSIIEDDVL